MSNITLGSLFDGSGGFPLGAKLCGIKPIWSSEIELFPIRVTTKRMPEVKHIGDITKIDGSKIEPVDIITFGSPCQDMSVAGKREGLKGEKSNLFYEATRVIKQMRKATNNQYPRYIVWENVVGAFSSNNGEDFKSVLEEIISIKGVNDEGIYVPKPNKWSKSGEIMGEDYSIAWRVFDAQYWGVPQRRRRIYLIADFDGASASKILFNPKSVPWHSKESKETWQRITGSVENCTRTTSKSKLKDLKMYENHGMDARYRELDETAPTVTANYQGGNNQPFVVTYDVRFTSEGTKNKRANVYKTDTSRTIDTGGNSPDSNQGGVAIVNDVTLQDVTYGISKSAIDSGYNTNFSLSVEEELAPTLLASGPGGVGCKVYEDEVYCTSKASFHTKAKKEVAGTLVATDYKDPPIINEVGKYNEVGRYNEVGKYKVRRLTPTECARLQGFPDWWCDNLEEENPSSNEVTKWKHIFDEYCENLKKKPRSENQIKRWLQNPYSDSAQYKMWGNGVALPNVVYVLNGIKDYLDSL